MGFVTVLKYVVLKTKKIFENAESGSEEKKLELNNYHTHTTFCDGNNTPEEMIAAAVDAGLKEIGFSGHSHLPGEPDWTMSKEGTKEYKKTVRELAEKYKDKITVKLGIEQDYWSDTADLDDYDYVIGAVHSLRGDDTTWSSVDYKLENFNRCAELYCDGDVMNMAEQYFELVGSLYERTHCDIIAHFDLITRFNYEVMKDTGKVLVDTNDKRYIAAEKKALDKLTATPVIFEINTGAMARGYNKVPYPGTRVLEYLGEKHTPVILSSDSHSCDTLTYAFDKAAELAEAYGLNIVSTISK